MKITHYTDVLYKDKRLSKIIIERLEPISVTSNIALKLMHSIMSQQLSTKVADILQQRFDGLFVTKKILPKHVLALPVDTIKAIGLSMQKAIYIHNIASFFEEHKLTTAALLKMSNDDIIATLTQIKGVGKWTF